MPALRVMSSNQRCSCGVEGAGFCEAAGISMADNSRSRKRADLCGCHRIFLIAQIFWGQHTANFVTSAQKLLVVAPSGVASSAVISNVRILYAFSRCGVRLPAMIKTSNRKLFAEIEERRKYRKVICPMGDWRLIDACATKGIPEKIRMQVHAHS